jgi:hypothetical protein
LLPADSFLPLTQLKQNEQAMATSAASATGAGAAAPPTSSSRRLHVSGALREIVNSKTNEMSAQLRHSNQKQKQNSHVHTPAPTHKQAALQLGSLTARCRGVLLVPCAAGLPAWLAALVAAVQSAPVRTLGSLSPDVAASLHFLPFLRDRQRRLGSLLAR